VALGLGLLLDVGECVRVWLGDPVAVGDWVSV
jgi:hypothetical protein